MKIDYEMTNELRAIVERDALPYPLDADDDEIQSYTLLQYHVPEDLWSEADRLFGAAQYAGGSEYGVYVIDAL